MVGAVGGDSFGQELVRSLKNSGVHIEQIVQKSETATGVAMITVEASGENTILLASGANALLSPQDLHQAIQIPQGFSAVLLQNEISLESTAAAIRWFTAVGVPVFYNAAPARMLPDALISSVDYLIVNESEADALTGLSVRDLETASVASKRLLERGAKAVVLTMGDMGALYQDVEGMRIHVPAFPVSVVDTTAAGDTFVGAFSVALCECEDIFYALRFASAAAALSVHRSGAQASIPLRRDVESFLHLHPEKTR
ncbi:ribokinase [Alicyclobacillaceae bacterium I2511]|nr:ribokinase [Alicyclobacillaceae bacterium I2511]